VDGGAAATVGLANSLENKALARFGALQRKRRWSRLKYDPRDRLPNTRKALKEFPTARR